MKRKTEVTKIEEKQSLAGNSILNSTADITQTMLQKEEVNLFDNVDDDDEEDFILN